MTPCSNSTYLVLQAYIWEKPQVKSVDHTLGKTAQRFKQTSGHFQKFQDNLKFQDKFRTKMKFQEFKEFQDSWDPCKHVPTCNLPLINVKMKVTASTNLNTACR
jgi:hypothetical protein